MMEVFLSTNLGTTDNALNSGMTKGLMELFWNILCAEDVLNLPNQLSNFSKNRLQGSETEFPTFTVKFYCILAHFCNVSPKIVKIPTNFTGKQKICFIISLERMI